MTALPDPVCKLGYPREQVAEIVGDRLAEFDEWMRGKTVAFCDGAAAEEWRCPSPHGLAAYRQDLRSFVNGGWTPEEPKT